MNIFNHDVTLSQFKKPCRQHLHFGYKSIKFSKTNYSFKVKIDKIRYINPNKLRWSFGMNISVQNFQAEIFQQLCGAASGCKFSCLKSMLYVLRLK